ncbi:MAG: protein kinase [Myxococcales bacterium]|nr:protein kinase [Myxococcales bacterium]MCB9577826.1 protein kinase [Polyangiaceae bacterium]
MGLAPVAEGDLIAGGKYRVEQILGEGGMGVVVAARHVELDQRVAVKFLLPEIAEHRDAAERFRREARAAVKITSEHVARVLDVGTSESGVPYMVMEYLSGNDLADELVSRGTLPVEEAVGWVMQASEAVAEAHVAGIIHRDLKPANLFLHQRADGSRLVKVLDFGISKSVNGGSMADLALTSTAALIGSPLYMSPEQMHSAKGVDARTDIWSLGVILFQLLAGRPPYVGESLPMLCSALLHDAPPPLSDFRNDVPPALEQAILGALQKDRTKRYSSVSELLTAIGPFGPPSMRVHLERASRMLSSADLRLSTDEPLTIVSGPKTGEGAPVTAHSGSSTQASWGKTGDPVEPTLPPKRSRRWIPAVAASGVVVLGLVAFGATRTTAVAEPSGKAAAQPEPPAPAEPAAPVKTAEPAPVVTAKPTAEPEAQDAGAAPSAEPSVTAKPRVVRPAAPAKPKATGVPTDFGGRR